jgi:hypothetical protein
MANASVTWSGNIRLLFRGDALNLAGFRLATLERFATSPVLILAQNKICLFPHWRNTCLGPVST